MKETNEYYNQKIQCDVKDCHYHDMEEERCTLGSILVSGKDSKENTFCDSFKEKEEEK